MTPPIKWGRAAPTAGPVAPKHWRLRCIGQRTAHVGRRIRRPSPTPSIRSAAHHAMSEGLAREGWDLDLRHGASRENALVHLLLRSHVEVKSDGLAAQTGR